MHPRLSLAASCLVLALGIGPALGQPVYKDSERFSEPGFAPEPVYRGGGGYGRVPQIETGPLRPHRRVMGDATYSGSEYGLSKPSYNGIGTRPDWGRSSH
jgi:hypothetical protein